MCTIASRLIMMMRRLVVDDNLGRIRRGGRGQDPESDVILHLICTLNILLTLCSWNGLFILQYRLQTCTLHHPAHL